MRILNNADFLTLWETGHRLHPLDRGLLAIRASLPEIADRMVADEPVADWPLGRRNRALAELRTLYFGPHLEGWTTCIQCGEKLEFEVDCRNLAETYDATSSQTIAVQGNTFRLPTSRDLARIADETDPQRAALLLLENCTIDHAATDPADWSETEIEAVTTEMARADPLAEIALGFECPVCQYTSEELLDLPSFLWAEIETRAKRLLLEVHALASRYGWAESAILAMSDIRRAAYLQMVQA
ncbi:MULTISPECIES: hypothetical protein [Acidobacteriaceae]|uniref:hypothetical protein n=1 Tax=Acidobacteriaceae TaxID=204434 RepID=UPI00131DDCDF|nr:MULTISPECIES: hypothetical protein [Acidobacteriaceae]MDW5265465.1 hypothetical protein [Edaphobacter sp.]